MKRLYWFALCIGIGFSLPLPLPLWGQDTIAISGALEWDKMELTASVSLELDALGIRLPGGRAQAEERISVETARLLRPLILAIPIDSSSTMSDLIQEGVFTLQSPEIVASQAHQVPPFLSADLRYLSTSYTIDLSTLSSEAIRHSRPLEIIRPVIPAPAASYSGIVIIADEAQPIHGRHTSALLHPCLFPKIWDSDMNLIYERNTLDPHYARKMLVHYAARESIFYSSPSGISPELIELVGANPLRIMARGVFGILPTDPIIDKDDALAILSTESNRQLLREGRVVFVVNQEVLRTSLSSN